MKNINWKAVMAGSATAIVLGVLSSFLLIFSPIISYGIYVGFIIGALLTGYMVGETCLDGAKNGILIVEFANQMKTELPLIDALKKACLLRFRPILMTTICTVLGALPLCLATGVGSAGRSQMGWCIVGGMLIGTLFTVFLVPSIYLSSSQLLKKES